MIWTIIMIKYCDKNINTYKIFHYSSSFTYLWVSTFNTMGICQENKYLLFKIQIQSLQYQFQNLSSASKWIHLDLWHYISVLFIIKYFLICCFVIMSNVILTMKYEYKKNIQLNPLLLHYFVAHIVMFEKWWSVAKKLTISNMFGLG